MKANKAKQLLKEKILQGSLHTSLNLGGSVKDLTESLRVAVDGPDGQRSAIEVNSPTTNVVLSSGETAQQMFDILEQCFERTVRELETMKSQVDDLTALVGELRTMSTKHAGILKTGQDRAIARIRQLEGLTSSTEVRRGSYIFSASAMFGESRRKSSTTDANGALPQNTTTSIS
jgi:hypothetical protein